MYNEFDSLTSMHKTTLGWDAFKISQSESELIKQN